MLLNLSAFALLMRDQRESRPVFYYLLRPDWQAVRVCRGLHQPAVNLEPRAARIDSLAL